VEIETLPIIHVGVSQPLQSSSFSAVTIVVILSRYNRRHLSAESMIKSPEDTRSVASVRAYLHGNLYVALGSRIKGE